MEALTFWIKWCAYLIKLGNGENAQSILAQKQEEDSQSFNFKIFFICMEDVVHLFKNSKRMNTIGMFGNFRSSITNGKKSNQQETFLQHDAVMRQLCSRIICLFMEAKIHMKVLAIYAYLIWRRLLGLVRVSISKISLVTDQCILWIAIQTIERVGREK